MSRRKGKGLGSPPKSHASEAMSRASAAQDHLRGATHGVCTMRLTSLEAAISSIAKAWTHAFDSGGKVAKGAITKRTVSEAQAKRLYEIDNEVSTAVGKFRRECIKGPS